MRPRKIPSNCPIPTPNRFATPDVLCLCDCDDTSGSSRTLVQREVGKEKKISYHSTSTFYSTEDWSDWATFHGMMMKGTMLYMVLVVPSMAYVSTFREVLRSPRGGASSASLDASSTVSSGRTFGRNRGKLASALSETMVDTELVLPDFTDQNEYLSYLEQVSALPKGFAVGVANGDFIPEEAPSMGTMNIRGTVIYLTEGPTDSWTAVFTKNKVRSEGFSWIMCWVEFVLMCDAVSRCPSDRRQI